MNPRTFETTIRACAHDVIVRWWDIVGAVTDEDLEAAAEDRIRRCLANDFSSGQLVYCGEDGSALGWWGIPGTVPP